VSEDRQILIIVHGEVKVNKMIRWSQICFWVSPRGENRRLEMIFRAPGLFYQGFKLLVPSNAARLSALCEWTTMECLFNGTMLFTVQIGGVRTDRWGEMSCDAGRSLSMNAFILRLNSKALFHHSGCARNSWETDSREDDHNRSEARACVFVCVCRLYTLTPSAVSCRKMISSIMWTCFII